MGQDYGEFGGRDVGDGCLVGGMLCYIWWVVLYAIFGGWVML